MVNSKLLSRNLGLLSTEQFDVIAGKTVLIAGCGVGSVIATGAARTGFHSFVLADGDSVDETNLNRQEYGASDVGKNKAEALSARLKEINSHISTRIVPSFLTPENIPANLEGVDIVIDAIDPLESPAAVIALHSMAKAKSIPVIYPIDIGWGGGIFIFTDKSASLEDMLGVGSDLNNVDISGVREKFLAYFTGIIPEYFGAVMSDIMTGKIENIPQPATAAYITAALSVVAMKRLVLGLPVKLAPEFIAFDPHTPHIVEV